MSLSSTPDGGFARPSGKTPPPPAPSAAFAKRARELQAQESLGGARYRPPALRSSKDTPTAEDAMGGGGDLSALAPPAFPPGFRRARAGTLPSNVQLAAQRYASTLPAAPLSDYEQTNEINNNTGINLATSNSTRPSLRHANSMAPAVPSATIGGERNSRLRSGSLTLPSAGLSNAFGPSIFSSSWLSNNGAGFPVLDEMRSITSGDSIMGADEYDVHTLDYLGLDDGPGAMASHGRHMPVPATVSELRNQAQATIVGHQTQNPSRNRSQTISNFARARSGTTSMITAPTIEHSDDEEEDLDYSSPGGNYGRQRMDSFDGNNGLYGGNGYVAKGFRQSQHLGPNTSLLARPRAISVGVLDDPNRAAAQRRSAAANAAIEQSSASLHRKTSYSNMNDANQSILVGNTSYVAAPTSILRQPSFNLDDEGSAAYPGRLTRQNSASVRFPSGDVTAPQMGVNTGRQVHLTAPIVRGESRSVSPKAEGMPNQIQTPSRSLWIGNLDPSMTGEDLAHVFAPYGAIESFRLLPEKECGFVNFVDIADAIRAKEDVLNRLSGHIGMSNNQAVRIGFGKADSAPATPPMGTQTSSAGIGLGAHIQSQFNPPGQTPQMQNQANALDSQLQSSPTRALWIGSIPSTTTPATILSVFSPYGPIESARVLTHKNCGFVNFERLDDAVRARKALNGRDVLGSDVGAIRIGFARVPVKNAAGEGVDEGMGVGVQGVGDLSVGATIHALRTVKGASTIPADQQVLGGSIENYRSNLLLSMIGSGTHQALGNNAANNASRNPTITEQQMVMLELSGGAADAEADIKALGEFRPPTMYYSTIPLVAERPHNRRWDASKLRDLRKRLDSGTCGVEEIDAVAADFLDGEIVDLASDWLGNTVVQKLFEKCSPGPRLAMLDRIAPHLAMIGIHKNGTWAAQKIIECSTTPEEVALVATNLRAYAPPLLLDQFGNYVVQCCLRFGSPQNDFIFDAVVDRLWEVAQGRFGARSMRACLESPQITISQQRKIATAIVLNSIPLATNPNGALLLTWLLDSSGFHSRYKLLAPRFTPHLAHLCTHKLASLTVLRIVNQRIEPEASQQIVHSLFNSPGDHVLTDVLGDQVNGVSVVHKILISPFLDPAERPSFLEATKRVLIDLKVTVTQAYRRLIEEVGLPLPNFQPAFAQPMPQPVKKGSGPAPYGMPGMPTGYPQQGDGLATMMQALQLQAQQQGAGPNNQSGLQINPGYGNPAIPNGMGGPPSGTSPATFSPTNDPFNPFARSPEMASRGNNRRGPPSGQFGPQQQQQQQQLYSSQQGAPSLAQAGSGLMGMGQPPFGMPPNSMPPQVYQAYMQQGGFMQPNSTAFHT